MGLVSTPHRLMRTNLQLLHLLHIFDEGNWFSYLDATRIITRTDSVTLIDSEALERRVVQQLGIIIVWKDCRLEPNQCHQCVASLAICLFSINSLNSFYWLYKIKLYCKKITLFLFLPRVYMDSQKPFTRSKNVRSRSASVTGM